MARTLRQLLRRLSWTGGVSPAVSGTPRSHSVWAWPFQAAPAVRCGVQSSRRLLRLAGSLREEASVAGTLFGLETGRLARLADGAVVCDSGGTAVLATVVAERFSPADANFLPLQARFYIS